ncbi:hypothetical protein [Lysinibacillus fusiformis]|uniref:hypothetical protein n=1 Tax=Lysinibacillus fusiformis TaxID=28031 RepID=UPI000684C825|nr:hypothetical protein [Lysinibacillus fusiformis]
MFMQTDYCISERNYEYSKIISIMKVHLEKMKKEGLNTDIIEKVINELETSGGENLTPQNMDFIFLILLEYVPEEVKDKY